MNKKNGRIWRIKAPGENHEVKALSASLGNQFEPLANVLVQRNLKTFCSGIMTSTGPQL
jgi:hypothetical protein